jgi:hypothetical protein
MEFKGRWITDYRPTYNKSVIQLEVSNGGGTSWNWSFGVFYLPIIKHFYYISSTI